MPFENALPESGKSSRNVAWISLSKVDSVRDRRLILYIRPNELKEAASWIFYKARLSIAVGTGDDHGIMRLTPKGSWAVTRSGGTQPDSQRALRIVLPLPVDVRRASLQDVACEIDPQATYLDVTLPKMLYATPVAVVAAVPKPPAFPPFKIGRNA